MEFACGRVYVAASTKPAFKANQIKRSALLPPKWARPRYPPPPPPALPRPPQLPMPPAPPQVKPETTLSPKHTPHYENVWFHQSSTAHTPTTPPAPAISPRKKPITAESFQNVSVRGALIYDLAKPDPENTTIPYDPEYSYSIPEGSGLPITPQSSRSQIPVPAPPLPPRPSFMRRGPEYVLLLPHSSSTTSSTHSSPSSSSVPSRPSSPAFNRPAELPRGPSSDSTARPADISNKEELPGNPNVILVPLGAFLSEENGPLVHGEPTTCSQCGSAAESYYDNVLESCYFCKPRDPSCPPRGGGNTAFLTVPNVEAQLQPEMETIIFCISLSSSMTTNTEVDEEGQKVCRSRLQLVQRALIECIHNLKDRDPSIRVGLITFNSQVTLHGCGHISSQSFQGDQLMDTKLLREAGLYFHTLDSLSLTQDSLEREIYELQGNGARALGPAAVVAVATASKHPGSKVLVFSDGKASAGLGCLEAKGSDPRSLVFSSIFYQALGEAAANLGVTVSVVGLEGTDCRLDELGHLADQTGGKVAIASPAELCSTFLGIVETQTIATHCTVTLLLPPPLCVTGEREAGHRVVREVGNVTSDTEITFQYGAKEKCQGSSVSMQLQVRFRRRDGTRLLRVVTVTRGITDDSSSVLSSISPPVLQLLMCQTGAALAVRGRFRDARRETDQQRQLLHRALGQRQNAEQELAIRKWLRTMEDIYNNLHHYTRRISVLSSDLQSLTDAGAALFYGMKSSNREGVLSLGGLPPWDSA